MFETSNSKTANKQTKEQITTTTTTTTNKQTKNNNKTNNQKKKKCKIKLQERKMQTLMKHKLT